MRALALPFCSLVASLGLAQQPVEAFLDEDREHLEELYRHLHQHPELSFREIKTAARMAQELRVVGVEVTEKVGGNGVVGVLRCGDCLLYTSPSPRDLSTSRMPSSA